MRGLSYAEVSKVVKESIIVRKRQIGVAGGASSSRNGLGSRCNGKSEDEQKTREAATTCLANTATLEWQAGQIVEHAGLAWFRV
jgi:hypothetical protein